MWDNFKGWLNQPFSADMDAIHWFYFFGLLITISAVWAVILHQLTKE